MIENYIKGQVLNFQNEVIGRISENFEAGSIIHFDSNCTLESNDYLAIICEEKDYNEFQSTDCNVPLFVTNKTINLSDGDIVKISERGELKVLYSTKSTDNVLFITENCNHRCIMCSQPPSQKKDFDYLFNLNMQVIELINRDCESLGVTGGEPTLLGKRLFSMYDEIADKLPDTIVHTLTNGRAFSSKNFCQNLLASKNENLLFGIPLYSDNPAQHNYIVQSKNAFEQTIKGLYNLASLNQRIEIRIVISKLNYERLLDIAHFIYKNLPFVFHVAFMGLEDVGHATKNRELVWMEPTEYMEGLSSAVEYLANFGVNVSIFNIPLCNLPPNLWQFSVRSISDWKTEYLEICENCKLKEECCGVFGTSTKISENIKPYLD
ncbi:His-Xaa-Ser system radical SAM maturase HxsC [Marinifilum fragile]|uniref:His-Xaa-Ser system radical SAM maturase HxsC n=1 Tax=Marinifilum fragile TaxID=570161 RepID=UPI002AAC48B5|nr:His-Xaa-Ser system radical SAM maturase HxsC [Marinifilum fragile]